MESRRYIPYMTISLIVINVIIFLIETALGGSESTEIALKFGAQYLPYVLADGDWYRVFTSMFVHFGIEHIFGNMIALIMVGQYIEVYFGRLKFLAIYFLGGLAGNLLSLIVEFQTNVYAVSAGASGAISGLFGALVILAFDKNTRRLFPLPRILIGIILLLIPAAKNVNVMAHLGGLLGGFATAYTFYYYKTTKDSADE